MWMNVNGSNGPLGTGHMVRNNYFVDHRFRCATPRGPGPLFLATFTEVDAHNFTVRGELSYGQLARAIARITELSSARRSLTYGETRSENLDFSP